MDSPTGIALAVAVGAPLFILGVLAIIVLAGRARPQPGLGPTSATSGEWNVQIPRSVIGGSLTAVSGRFRVDRGRLSFVPSGATVPQWQIPCAEIAARANTAFATAGVDLWLPSGHLRCTVSREHINVLSRNTIKSMREPTYYREFVDVLVASGARAV